MIEDLAISRDGVVHRDVSGRAFGQWVQTPASE
jgi:hypothetical protein